VVCCLLQYADVQHIWEWSRALRHHADRELRSWASERVTGTSYRPPVHKRSGLRSGKRSPDVVSDADAPLLSPDDQGRGVRGPQKKCTFWCHYSWANRKTEPIGWQEGCNESFDKLTNVARTYSIWRYRDFPLLLLIAASNVWWSAYFLRSLLALTHRT